MKKYLAEFSKYGDGSTRFNGFWEICGDRLVNQKGGWHDYRPSPNDEIFEVENYEDLPFRKYYVNNTYKTGWLDRNGNFFETRIEAEEASYRTKYTNLFKKYVEAHSSVVDWDDMEQEIWSLNYDRNNGELLVQCSSGVGVQKQGAIYSTNKKAIEDAIEFVGKENVIEYIFGA